MAAWGRFKADGSTAQLEGRHYFILVTNQDGDEIWRSRRTARPGPDGGLYLVQRHPL
jgi:hypothetical protein